MSDQLSYVYCVLLTVDQLHNYKIYRNRKKIVSLDNGRTKGGESPKTRGGGRGGAPELPKFLLIMTVYCIEMYYLSLYTKDKKTFLFIGTATCFRIQQP